METLRNFSPGLPMHRVTVPFFARAGLTFTINKREPPGDSHTGVIGSSVECSIQMVASSDLDEAQTISTIHV